MNDEDPSTNGGCMVIVISSFITKQVHIKGSIIHDSIEGNHIQNKNKNQD